ncbi:hypothetical protein B9T27_07435 [Acinetobacter sp. ANC 4648]|nr:hypothetical protein B9T27_07435 [Acinetobacter sp. ANC 4648]
MNLNRVEHQRSILAVLGIDIWVPKINVQAQKYQNTLYRDVAMPGVVIEETNFQAGTPPVAISNQQIIQPAEVALLRSDENSRHSNIQRQPQQIEPVVEAVPALKNDIENSAPLKIEIFELQAYCLEQCVMIIDATQLSTEQSQLWNNIQAAKIGKYAELKWPFPLSQFQDGRGASLYIQGFLDALTQDKQVLALGEIVHLHDQKIIALAGLQEMLDQPLLKKRLWQFMQN